MAARHLANHRPAGFTLLEMSLVLAIIGVLTAGVVSMGMSMIASTQLVSSRNKLDVIETALMGYRLGNNRLPCPSDPTLTDIPANATTFGYETGTAGTCGGGATVSYTVPTPSSNTTITDTGTVVEGAVPVRTLGLPDEYQWDAWGRKFSYAVWTPLTAQASSTGAPAGFINYGINPSCGAITVNNAGGGHRTTSAAYALISYGPDGHGGYLKGGTRYFMGSDNAAEWTNCHCNATADTGYAATYVQQDVTQTSSSDSLSVFDDLVRFKDRWQMQNDYDTYVPIGSSCSPGFSITPVSSNWQGLGEQAVAIGDVNGDGIADLILATWYTGKVYVIFGTKTGFPDPLPVTSLNGSNGFELDASYGITGAAVGDVNGDGVADIIIGARGAKVGANTAAGSVYVVFGGTTRKDGTAWSSCPCTLNAGFLNGTNGAQFDGNGTNYYAGSALAAGDVNGDGIPDLIIDAEQVNSYTGAVYVVFGKTGAWSGTATKLDTTLLNGTTGVEFDGTATGNYTGYSLAAGDVNGDGVADLIIGADQVTIGGQAQTGAVYVVFGKKSGLLPSTTVSTTSGSNSATVASATGLLVGQTVYSANIPAGTTISAIAGTTLTLSANATATASGTALNISSVLLNSSYLNGTNGTEYDGVARSGNKTGWSVAAGDVNGDGTSDVVIGAAVGAGTWGSVYIVFGKSNGWPTSAATLQTGYGNALDGIIGVDLESGVDTAGRLSLLGAAVAVADVNGDGIGDLAIGAPYSAISGNGSAGQAVVVFGNTTGILPSTTVTTTNNSFSATVVSATGLYVGQTVSSANIPAGTTINAIAGTTLTLSNKATATAAGTAFYVSGLLNSSYLNGITGVELDGGPVANAEAGWVIAAGDLNGDGIADLAIPAPTGTVGGNHATTPTYVYFGRKYNWPTAGFNLGGL